MEQITIDDIKYRTYPNTVTGCWMWRLSTDRHGYASWTSGKKHFGTRAVHRITFFLRNGSLPVWPDVLDHTCKNKACVNPDHLRVLSFLENSSIGIRDKNPDTCPMGHNHWRIRDRNKGGRECLDCRKYFKAKYRARKKAGLVKPRAKATLGDGNL